MGSTDEREELSEAVGGEWPIPYRSIWQHLELATQQHPNRLAVVCLHQPNNLYAVESIGNTAYLRWSYGQLYDMVTHLASQFLALQVEPGMTIATVVGNGIEFQIFLWLARMLRCVFKPLHPQDLRKAQEMRHMIKVGGAHVIVTDSVEAASQVDEYLDRQEPVLKIIASLNESVAGWTNLSDLTARDTSISSETASLPTGASEPDDTVSVLFTSGTTALPKGCPLTNRTINAFINLPFGRLSSHDTFCGVISNHHAAGHSFVLHFLCRGGTIVYPSASYEVVSCANAIVQEACTHAFFVPTMLQSLVAHAQERSLKFSTLVNLCLAGSMITPLHLQQVRTVLGASHVSTGFGMTEGCPAWAEAVSDPAALTYGDASLAGGVTPGARIRVCKSGSAEIIPRGVAGEIHQAGPQIISRYLNDQSPESFYMDEQGMKWFKSGDEGIMYPDGRISLVGRFKDLINRGGKKIAPAAIEAVLDLAAPVQAQVIAVKDDIAGEVPFAVVKSVPTSDGALAQLKNTVRDAMGPSYVPVDIVALEAIGLTDYPRSAANKVNKSILAAHVAGYRAAQAQQHMVKHTALRSSDDTSLLKSVRDIWHKATGIEIAELGSSTPLIHIADSITLMRVRHLYHQNLGRTLTMADMTEKSDLQSHVDALEMQPRRNADMTAPEIDNASVEPPTLQELQIIVGPKNEATSMKDKIQQTVGRHGFEWDKDVAAVLQVTDLLELFIRTSAIDSATFDLAFITSNASLQLLRNAWVATLKNNPIWPAFCVQADGDDTPFLVTLKPSQKLLGMCLTYGGELSSVSQLQQMALVDFPGKRSPTRPGPLVHIHMFDVKETNTAGFILSFHHAVQDHTYMRLVLEDLDRALVDPIDCLPARESYQVWADLYTSLRNSPRAFADVDWHVARLADINRHKSGIFPSAAFDRRSTNDNSNRIWFSIEAPALIRFRQRHPRITAALVLKAALALANVTRTKHTHALFSNFEAARNRIPFLSENSSLRLPDASQVAGPIFTFVVNCIAVRSDDTALSFLNNLQDEQEELTKRALGPWLQVIDKLNDIDRSQRAGDCVGRITSAQFLTWIPGGFGKFEAFRYLESGVPLRSGLVILAFLDGLQGSTYSIAARWDVANFSEKQTLSFLNDIEKAVVWLLDEKNENLPIGSLLDTLV